MNDLILKKLELASCCLLPGRIPPRGSDCTDLYNKTFLYWKSFWNGVFKDNGTTDLANIDDFMRQDMICVIAYKEEIIGMHLYSFNSLDNLAFFQHSYCKNGLSDLYFQKVTACGVRSVMSLEYLTVDPMWRKRAIGFNTAHFVCGIGFTLLGALAIDAIICPARKDVKVSEVVQSFGGEVIVPNVELHNTPCDLLLARKEKLRPQTDPHLANLIENLWQKRIDFTGMTKGKDYSLIRKSG